MSKSLGKRIRKELSIKVKEFKKAIAVNLISCYAEERLSGYEYEALLYDILHLTQGFSGHEGEIQEDGEEQQSIWSKFARRKLFNPFNTIRFLLLSLLTNVDYFLRIIAGAVMVLSMIFTYPLSFVSPFLVNLFSLPGMLISWAFHSSINAVRIVTEHLFSPINSFIRPMWNYFKGPDKLATKIFVAGSYIWLTAAVTAAAVLTGGTVLPLGLLIAGGIILSPLLIHATFKIMQETLLSLWKTGKITFEGKTSYSERYSAVDHSYAVTNQLLSKERFVRSIEGNKAPTQALFHSAPRVRIAASSDRTFLETAASFFTGWEPEEPELKGNNAWQPTYP